MWRLHLQCERDITATQTCQFDARHAQNKQLERVAYMHMCCTESSALRWGTPAVGTAAATATALVADAMPAAAAAEVAQVAQGVDSKAALARAADAALRALTASVQAS